MELILESSGTYLWLGYRIGVKIRLRCCQHGQDSWKQAHWDWIWVAFFFLLYESNFQPFLTSSEMKYLVLVEVTN